MKELAQQKGHNEGENKYYEQELFEQCLMKAEGDKKRAQAYYNYRLKADLEPKSEELDQREKWPMLTPLLILYTLGTIGVLVLVYCFLANRLG